MTGGGPEESGAVAVCRTGGAARRDISLISAAPSRSGGVSAVRHPEEGMEGDRNQLQATTRSRNRAGLATFATGGAPETLVLGTGAGVYRRSVNAAIIAALANIWRERRPVGNGGDSGGPTIVTRNERYRDRGVQSTCRAKAKTRGAANRRPWATGSPLPVRVGGAGGTEIARPSAGRPGGPTRLRHRNDLNYVTRRKPLDTRRTHANDQPVRPLGGCLSQAADDRHETDLSRWSHGVEKTTLSVVP